MDKHFPQKVLNVLKKSYNFLWGFVGGGETEGRGGGEGEEDEKKDKLPENPISSATLRASIRSLSPFRRHSWEPGRNATGDIDMAKHRYGL